MSDQYQLVIDGDLEHGARGTYPVTNPARPAEVVLEAPSASLEQLDRAVSGARRAFGTWAARPAEDRVAAVTEAGTAGGRAVEAEDLPRLLTREHGKVLVESMFDAGVVGGMAAALAPAAIQATQPELVADDGGHRTRIQHVPTGVVAAILPFNWPVAVMANKVLPALLTGNTVIVKAPPTCPAAVLQVVTAMAATLPDGVLNVVNGPEAALGEALVTHGGVDMVSFTGGVGTGRAVMAAAAEGIKPVVLELGGNDPAILAPDLAIDEALAERLVEAAFPTSGQVCMAIKRLYVHQDRLDGLVDALTSRLSGEVVGDGLADGVTMGPVHRPAARDRVERFIAEAESGGARVHRPGHVRDEDRNSGGYFVNPALVVDPSPTSSVVREEQFAPVLPLLPYRDIEQAVTEANDSSFGLCASVWSNDEQLTAGIAERLEAGTVFVNSHGMSAMDPRAPMGGWKQSGLGVELGVDGMRAFTKSRTVLAYPGQQPAPS